MAYFLGHPVPVLRILSLNVPSKLRGRARGKKKRRAAVFNCRAVNFNVLYTFEANQAAGLWILVWRVDTGCRGRATLGECQMSPISLFSWATSVKKIQALTHYTFPRTKKIRGNIVLAARKEERELCYSTTKSEPFQVQDINSISGALRAHSP